MCVWMMMVAEWSETLDRNHCSLFFSLFLSIPFHRSFTPNRRSILQSAVGVCCCCLLSCSLRLRRAAHPPVDALCRLRRPSAHPPAAAMPPKDQASKKNVEKKKSKTIEDRTFGQGFHSDTDWTDGRRRSAMQWCRSGGRVDDGSGPFACRRCH